MATKDDKSETPNTKPPGEPAPQAASAPAPVAAPAAPSAERKTPAAWATQLGHVKPANPLIPQSTEQRLPAFAVANELYGWSKHAYDYQAEGDEFLITLATYQAALKSAPQFPACELTVEALTPAAAANLANHKPKTNLKAERAQAEAEAKAAAKAEAKKAEKP